MEIFQDCRRGTKNIVLIYSIFYSALVDCRLHVWKTFLDLIVILRLFQRQERGFCNPLVMRDRCLSLSNGPRFE